MTRHRLPLTASLTRSERTDLLTLRGFWVCVTVAIADLTSFGVCRGRGACNTAGPLLFSTLLVYRARVESQAELKYHALPVPRALDRRPRRAHPQHALQGVHEEGDRPLAGVVPHAAGRHDRLAGGDGRPGQGRLPRLRDVRVLPPVPP